MPLEYGCNGTTAGREHIKLGFLFRFLSFLLILFEAFQLQRRQGGISGEVIAPFILLFPFDSSTIDWFLFKPFFAILWCALPGTTIPFKRSREDKGTSSICRIGFLYSHLSIIILKLDDPPTQTSKHIYRMNKLVTLRKGEKEGRE